MLNRNLIYDTLQKTLRGIVDDSDSDYKSRSVIGQLYDEETSEKAYEDYQEFAGPPYISEKGEGAVVSTVEMLRGYGTRIWMRTFGAKMVATEEAIDDGLYQDIIRCARYLRDAADNTRELDAAMTFGRAFNTDYTMGDGQPLCSASHTLADGRTWSNLMSTPYAPSYQALNIARASVKLFPNHAGIRSARRILKIVHPVEQDTAWDAILLSNLAPYAGNTSEINVVRVKDGGITHIGVPQLLNTSTNWFALTDNPVGIKWFTRKKLSSTTKTDEEVGTVTYIIKERRGRGPVDARKVFGVAA